MALDHRTKIFAVQQCRVSKLLQDAAVAPSAPSAPSAPTVTPITSGSTSYSYTAILSNGTDSAASTAGSTSTGAASPNNTVTVTAVPAGQVAIIQRTVGGLTQGVIGTIGPGGTSLIDANLPATAYVANTSGLLYAPSIPIPGTKSLKVTGTVATLDLRGDNTLLDTDTMLTGVGVELDHAKFSFDLISLMLGGTVVDSGATPNQKTTWALPDPPVFSYFKLEGRSMSADPAVGDFHHIFWKVKLADFPQVGLAEENYQLFALKCKAVPTVSTSVWYSPVLNETAVAVV